MTIATGIQFIKKKKIINFHNFIFGLFIYDHLQTHLLFFFNIRHKDQWSARYIIVFEKKKPKQSREVRSSKEINQYKLVLSNSLEVTNALRSKSEIYS